MKKKTFSLVFVLTLLTLLMLVSFVRASVGPLQFVTTITLDKKPNCIAVNEETNLVYVGVEDGLIVIDGESYDVVADIPLEAEVIGLTINPQTNRIYAVVYGKRVVAIDGATNQIVGEMPETIFDSSSGVGIDVNPFTNLVYIEDRTATMGQYDRVVVYNGETLALVTSLNIPGSNEYSYMVELGLAVNPEANRIYVTWGGNNTLHMFDGNTYEFIKSVSPSSFSEAVKVNTYTNYVYVGDVVLDGETLVEVISDYAGDLEAVDSVNNLLYTVDYHNLYVLNGTTHDIVTSLELDWYFTSYSDCVGVNCETDKVYLVDNSENQIPIVLLIPEFPTWTSMLLVLFALAVAMLLYRRRLFKAPIHQQSSAL